MMDFLFDNINILYAIVIVAGLFGMQYIWFLEMKKQLHKEQQTINQREEKLKSERELINKEKKEATELLEKATLAHKANLENNAKLEKKKAAYSIYD